MSIAAGMIAGSVGGSIVSGLTQNRQAAKNRKFQKKMYQRRYQYTVKDMKKAGLNPILAAGNLGGGTGTPGAMPSTPDYGSSVGTGVKLAQEGKLKKEQRELANQQAAQSAVQIKLLEAQIRKTDMETESIGWRKPFATIGETADDILKGTKARLTNAEYMRNVWSNTIGDTALNIQNAFRNSPGTRAVRAVRTRVNKKGTAGTPKRGGGHRGRNQRRGKQ